MLFELCNFEKGDHSSLAEREEAEKLISKLMELAVVREKREWMLAIKSAQEKFSGAVGKFTATDT